MSASVPASPLVMAQAVLPGTPQEVIDAYATLSVRAETRSFGLIEDDVVVLDTETTGLSHRENELIEIAAARCAAGGRRALDTFVKPHALIPAEITELTNITNADVAHAPSAEELWHARRFVGGAPVIAHNAALTVGLSRRSQAGPR